MISYLHSQQILKRAAIKIGDEIINSENALNRVLSLNIFSKHNYPAANNTAFDGFAINSKDTKFLNKDSAQKFKIVGSLFAGTKPIKKKIKKFEAVEIMTGGIVPKGFDTIIPIEQIVFYPSKDNPKYIIVNKKINKHQHVRFLGSDYKKNDLIIKKGTIVQPNHILALKTLGIKKIEVKKKPNILFFSTGNEISNNENIPAWKVRNSNGPYIKSLNENFLFHFINGGILRDHHASVFKNQIKKFIKSKIDIIVTSGAVSAGKFDFIPSVINTFKISNYFKGVAIQPGKPVLFAKIKGKQKALFGLPGNPLSTAACYRFFVHPYMMNILGVENEKPIKVILKNNFYKKKHITQFIKAKLNGTNNGKLELEVLQGQESFRIKPFVHSNIWAVFPSGKSNFKRGEMIESFFPNHPNEI
ncbi:MAG: molybdopterin molybdenumtransferase MoeA [Candidatus Fonsibacter sp.]|nr:molybdopterin molybdenumtransferase MoeA [Candidatus Fonsibacter sp.]